MSRYLGWIRIKIASEPKHFPKFPSKCKSALLNTRRRGCVVHYHIRNFGDYYKKANGLNMLQHGAYNLIRDKCYDLERFPTKVDAIAWAWANTDDEINAVEFVLSRLFTEIDGLYVQDYIQSEIDDFQSKKESCSKAGIASGVARRSKKIKRPLNDRSISLNQPITNNQKPVTKNQVKKLSFDDFWDIYPRKDDKKKAQPIWKKLPLAKQQAAMADCGTRYIGIVQQFIPHPTTYLNGERWTDEKIKIPIQPVEPPESPEYDLNAP